MIKLNFDIDSHLPASTKCLFLYVYGLVVCYFFGRDVPWDCVYFFIISKCKFVQVLVDDGVS